MTGCKATPRRSLPFTGRKNESSHRDQDGRRLWLPGWESIRGRVSVVLAIPTCLLLVAVGLAVSGRAQAYGDARRTQAAVAFSLRVQGLVHELQLERGLTNGLLSGAGNDRAPLDTQRTRVDTALTALRRDVAASADTPESANTAETAALRRLDRLSAVRASVDHATADRAATLRFFTADIGALDAADPVSDTTTRDDRQLRDGLDALQSLAEATESAALERGSLNGVFAAGTFRGTEYLDFAQVRAQRLAAVAGFDRSATPAQRADLNRAFGTAAAKRATAFERTAQSGADGSRLRADPKAWWSAMTVLVDDLYRVQQQVGADLRARAGQLSSAAAVQLAGYLALGLVVTALVAGAALLAARSITRPLDALAREADEIARDRLPEAVRRIQEASPDDAAALAGLPYPSAPSGPEPPRRRAHRAHSTHRAREIAGVAAAFQGVERTALRLAVEQAVLRRNSTQSLASLGRRNQGLIHRQLDLISALENQEIDPDALGNLFQLDHLATRMRRNAESLLVLAGEHTPRPVTGTASGLDIVRSAIGEVEQYQRVVTAEIAPCRIRGHAAAELAHLLAELIENALAFSPPAEPVEVHGWYDGDEYAIAVVDHGVGMARPDMERANTRLAGQEALLIAPTRFLGHYVVGRLARRHHVEVRLYDTPGAGVTALAVLPPRLLDPRPADPVPAATVPARADGHGHVTTMLNGFRAGVARAEGTKEATS